MMLTTIAAVPASTCRSPQFSVTMQTPNQSTPCPRAGPGRARRPALAAGQPDGTEDQGAGQQAAQGQRTRVEVPPRVADRHEGRCPGQDRD
jgi:hypothetical protein